MTVAEVDLQIDIARVTAGSITAQAATVAGIVSDMQQSFAFLELILAIQWGHLEGHVLSMTSGIFLYTEAIYLDLLTEVSHAADLVLTSYRNMMIIVFGRIGDVSVAAGQPACFMQNAILNVRSIVLNSLGSMGRRFMSSELVWLKGQNQLFEMILKNLDEYTLQPAKLFADMDALLVQPSIDAQADNHLFVVKLIERMSDVIDAQQHRLAELAETIEQRQTEFLRLLTEGIQHVLNITSDRLDQFENQVVIPGFLSVEETIGEHADRITQIEEKLSALDDRLALPGDFLWDATKLSDPVRTDQLDKIARAASLHYSYYVDHWHDEIIKRRVT